MTFPLTAALAYQELPAQTLESNTSIGPGTYLMTGTVTIPTNVTLTIQPGTVIKANSWWHRFEVVGGTLIATAQGASTIIFTSSNDSSYGEAIEGAGAAGPDQWSGIYLRKDENGHRGQVWLNNCILRYGGGWTNGILDSRDGDYSIQDCRFEYSGENGIHIINTENDSATNDILDTVFYQNSDSGIHMDHPTTESPTLSDPDIRGCHFDGNGWAATQYNAVFPHYAAQNTITPRIGVVNGIRWKGTLKNLSGQLQNPGPNFPYVLSETFYVTKEGATPGVASLTIGAGTIIKANSWWNRIEVTGGELYCQGQADAPIHMTSFWDDSVGGDTNGDGAETTGAPDQWAGIRLVTLEAGESHGTILSSASFNHTHFAYGGGYTNALVEADDCSPEFFNCSFAHSADSGVSLYGQELRPASASFILCDFLFNGQNGVYVTHPPVPYEGVAVWSSDPLFTGCTFRGNGRFAVELNGNVFPRIGEIVDGPSRNTLIEEPGVNNGVAIGGPAITKSGQLDPFGDDFPYILNDSFIIEPGVTLSIGGGTIIKGNSWWHRFDVYGSLWIYGNTVDGQVRMTSFWDDSIGGDTNGDGAETTAAPDQWGGIQLKRREGIDTPPSVNGSYTHMYYGGGYTSALLVINGGTARFDNSSFNYSAEHGVHFVYAEDACDVWMQRCTFVGNTGIGLYGNHEAALIEPLIEGCTFTNNGGFAMRFLGPVFPRFDGTNVITQGVSQGTAGIAIEGTIDHSGTLEYPGNPAPFIIDGSYVIENGVRIDIDPGCVFKGNSWWHRFDVTGGELVALGTVDKPIYFTSLWDDSIAGDTNNDGADSTAAGDQWGGVHILKDSTTGAPGKASFQQCHLYYGGGYTNALIEADAGTVSFEDGTLAYSAESGLSASDNAIVTVHNSHIHDNGSYGIYSYSSTHMVDARSNFWGSSGGPLDASDAEDLVKAAGYIYHNPDAEGNRVSNNVRYDNWLSGVPDYGSGYIWSGATPHDNNWRFSTWYGWFQDHAYPYILHQEHGWQLILVEDLNNLILWDFGLNSYLWISQTYYPYFYKFGNNSGWYFFYAGSVSSNRWFRQLSTGVDIHEGALRD
jgi:hypothetical protein